MLQIRTQLVRSTEPVETNIRAIGDTSSNHSIRPFWLLIQVATANAVNAMKLSHESLTLIDGCSATGSLFFGLKTYPWKSVILYNLNPLRTNFLNVLKKKTLSLLKRILEADLSFIE